MTKEEDQKVEEVPVKKHRTRLKLLPLLLTPHQKPHRKLLLPLSKTKKTKQRNRKAKGKRLNRRM